MVADMDRPKLVPTWRRWWRRYSTWLALAIPVLTALREALPQLQEVIPLDTYKAVSALLGFAVVLAVHIKQKSVSGDDEK